MDVLTIDHLTKRFGEKEVLKGLSLKVPANSIFGFIGQNGAGKTTTMKAVLGLLMPDSGDIRVMGERVTFGATATNRYIGYLPDVPMFYPFMTAKEYLLLCGDFLHMKKAESAARADELLSLVGLSGENHRIKGFSRGMKQRLGIAQALFARPKLLICDEPTSALDPIGRREILDLLLSVKDHTTVLFSTHILSDVERICTDVALLSDGKIALQGKIDALKRTKRKEEFTIEMSDTHGRDTLARAFHGARPMDGTTLLFTGGDAEMFDTHRFIKENGLTVRKIERAEASLESLFWEVVNS